MARSARRRTRTPTRTGWAWRWQSRTYSDRAQPAWRLPRWVHGATFTRTQGDSRRRCRGRARTLKDGLARHRAAGRRSSLGPDGTGRRKRPNRSFVNRTRTGLRHDDARRRCGRPRGGHRRSRRPRGNRRGCNWGGLRHGRRRSRGHHLRSRRCWRTYGSRRRGRSRRDRNGRRCRCCRRSRRYRRRYHRPRRRGRSHRSFSYRGHWGNRSSRCSRGWRRRRLGYRRTDGSSRSLLLADGTENIARPRNMGEINLGLDLIAPSSAETTCLRCGRSITRGSAKMHPHLLRFVIFERAGVSFLFCDTHHGKHVENCLTLDLKLPGQIVNSNLAHSPVGSSNRFRPRLHVNLTVSFLQQ